MSNLALNQQISNEKYKISISFSTLEQLKDEEEIYNYFLDCKNFKIKHHLYDNNIDKYINIECSKKDMDKNKIKYLIDHEADINKIMSIKIQNYRDYYECIPINNACKNGNEALVKFLVEHGADVNKRTNLDKTPLFNAFSSGNETIVKYLVEHGADINNTDLNGKTPLFSACSSGNGLNKEQM